MTAARCEIAALKTELEDVSSSRDELEAELSSQDEALSRVSRVRSLVDELSARGQENEQAQPPGGKGELGRHEGATIEKECERQRQIAEAAGEEVEGLKAKLSELAGWHSVACAAAEEAAAAKAALEQEVQDELLVKAMQVEKVAHRAATAARSMKAGLEWAMQDLRAEMIRTSQAKKTRTSQAEMAERVLEKSELEGQFRGGVSSGSGSQGHVLDFNLDLEGPSDDAHTGEKSPCKIIALHMAKAEGYIADHMQTVSGVQQSVMQEILSLHARLLLSSTMPNTTDVSEKLESLSLEAPMRHHLVLRIVVLVGMALPIIISFDSHRKLI